MTPSWLDEEERGEADTLQPDHAVEVKEIFKEVDQMDRQRDNSLDAITE